jgi:microcystin-dependent protein
MSNPFIGQINIVGFNYAYRGSAFCNGQLMAISQNTALFSLLGTTYGGNGTTNFALPNFQGRAPMHFGTGTGAGITTVLGQTGGSESVALAVAEMATHTHTSSVSPQSCSTGPGTSNNPAGNFPGITQRPFYTENATGSLAALSTNSSAAGSGVGHENRQPFLTMNFVINLIGIFPTRN